MHSACSINNTSAAPNNERPVLVVIPTYERILVALYSASLRVAFVSIPSQKTSAELLPVLEKLFSENGIVLHDMAYIAVWRGPAPFTTLRVGITTINGIAFATGIKLVGVDGLKLLALKQRTSDATVVVLLNAFCRDLYVGICRPGSDEVYTACLSVEKTIELLAQEKGKIILTGNGTQMYRRELDGLATVEYGPMLTDEELCDAVFAQGTQEKCVEQVAPLYLKEASYGKQWCRSDGFD